MEVEEIQAQACKFPRIGNGRNDSSKIGQNKGGEHQYPDDDEDGELRRVGSCAVAGGDNRLRGWHHSSRIIRVSRASGGKDRHSKVWTSKGLRDRRVRLSVTTAIQFYDLQDRLGYDQPSKAVEWLIKAASDAISELPSLNSSSFPDTPKQLSDEKRAGGGVTEQGFDSAEMELDADQNYQQNQNQQLSMSKSSSTSETSKGSGLSLSRSEVRVNRVKASRERAKERAAKEKEKEKEQDSHSIGHHHQNVNPISQNSSFTELLTGGGVSNGPTSPTGSGQQNHGGGGEATLYGHNKAARQWSPATTPMDYFSSGLLGASSSTRAHHSAFTGQIQLGNSISMPQPISYNVGAGDNNHPELQQFSFVPDHFIPVSSQPGSGGGDYNLNFTISSGGLAGYNRGTLQSNSPSFLPHHLQRFSSPIDGSNVPFFIGTAAPAAASPVENHHQHQHQHHQHQFPAGFDGRLQLCYGDGSSRHSDHKEKGKN